MLSVIIPTQNSEQALVPTLAALVAGATEGLVREVLLADAGSQDDTVKIADIAGCDLVTAEGPLGRRLKIAAAKARAPWLMFLRPGTVLDAPWTAEVGRFMQREAGHDRAAVFRRGGAPSALAEIASLLATALGARPRPEQGLLIARPFYDALGGHAEDTADPERDLLRRIGRKRTMTLATTAAMQILD